MRFRIFFKTTEQKQVTDTLGAIEQMKSFSTGTKRRAYNVVTGVVTLQKSPPAFVYIWKQHVHLDNVVDPLPVDFLLDADF